MAPLPTGTASHHTDMRRETIFQQESWTAMMQRIMLAISGFGAGGSGALIIERALARVPGVIQVYVNPATEMAYVTYDTQQCHTQHLREALRQAGFAGGSEHAVSGRRSIQTVR